MNVVITHTVINTVSCTGCGKRVPYTQTHRFEEVIGGRNIETDRLCSDCCPRCFKEDYSREDYGEMSMTTFNQLKDAYDRLRLVRDSDQLQGLERVEIDLQDLIIVLDWMAGLDAFAGEPGLGSVTTYQNLTKATPEEIIRDTRPSTKSSTKSSDEKKPSEVAMEAAENAENETTDQEDS